MDNYDLSIRVIYVLGTLGFSVGTAVMAMFANVYIAMIMISTMGIVSMSISYCPYALLGQYHDIKEVRLRPRGLAGRVWARAVTGRGPPGSKACLISHSPRPHCASHKGHAQGPGASWGFVPERPSAQARLAQASRLQGVCSFGYLPAGARCPPACCWGSRRLPAPVVPSQATGEGKLCPTGQCKPPR